MNKATTLKTHAEAGHMSQETAVKSLASDYDIDDPEAEVEARTGQAGGLAASAWSIASASAR